MKHKLEIGELCVIKGTIDTLIIVIKIEKQFNHTSVIEYLDNKGKIYKTYSTYIKKIN